MRTRTIPGVTVPGLAVLCINAASGDVLYRFNTGGSIGGGIVTYARDGRQFVATASGTVSALCGGSGLPAVIVFALP